MFQKIKNIYKEASNKKVLSNKTPQKNRISDSKYNFIVMRRGPKAPRRAWRAPQPFTGAKEGAWSAPNFYYSMIQNEILKFSKTKIKLKRTPQSSKKSKTYIRRPQIKKFYKTYPTKSGNSDSKYNFKIFKNQKSN